MKENYNKEPYTNSVDPVELAEILIFYSSFDADSMHPTATILHCHILQNG